MRKFDGPSRIAGVQIAEIRIREIGSAPSAMAKMAFMTSTGESAGMYVQHMFSDRTRALLQGLYESMEADAVAVLSEPLEPAYVEEQEYDDGDGDMSYR